MRRVAVVALLVVLAACAADARRAAVASDAQFAADVGAVERDLRALKVLLER